MSSAFFPSRFRPSLCSSLAFGLLIQACLTTVARAWGEPHLAITRAAVAVLAPWQLEVLGKEAKALGDDYCLIPDHVFSDKANAGFATMESQPGVVYIKKLHLPEAEQRQNLETLQVFMDKAVRALHAGATGDGARYMGTLCHVLEDFGSPSHTIPGDNMFTLLQQFMPPSESMHDQLLHGPVENGTFVVSIAGYRPRLLGATVAEASWRLLHRVHEGIVNARSTTFPIIQALYAGDEEGRVKAQMKAATFDAQVVADALHTVLCLGAGKYDGAEVQALTAVDIAAFWPVEAVNLYFPQSTFFSAPFRGHARVGVVLEGGLKAVPLRLRLQDADGATVDRVFASGISTGMGRPLTWHLPVGIYKRFRVRAGLQTGIGDQGRVEFTIFGDGVRLGGAVLGGGEPSQKLECSIESIAELRLAAESRGLHPKSNYAVWADPLLEK